MTIDIATAGRSDGQGLQLQMQDAEHEDEATPAPEAGESPVPLAVTEGTDDDRGGTSGPVPADAGEGAQDAPEPPPEEIDILILGGGIHGAAMFRELSLQGVKVVLAEKADFGSGSSGAGSRLAHTGLRQLERGAVEQSRQAMLEANLLLRNAPHAARPMRTLLLSFWRFTGFLPALGAALTGGARPVRRGTMVLRAGLWFQDVISAQYRMMPRLKMLNRRRALRDVAGLNPGISGAGQFYDVRLDQPERLIWELIRDGRELGGRAFSRTATTCADRRVLTLRPPGRMPLRLHPRIVVNATGAWLDQTNALLGMETRLIDGIRRSHLLLDNPSLVQALNGRMICFPAEDGRICRIGSWQGRALLGTTDSPAEDPDAARCSDGEIAYLLQAMARMMPGHSTDPAQIVYATSGIQTRPTAATIASGRWQSRGGLHLSEPVTRGGWPVFSLIGGDWARFRGLAEQQADVLLTRLGRLRTTHSRALPIGGGRAHPRSAEERAQWIARLTDETRHDPDRLLQLLSRYGGTAREMARELDQMGRWREEDRLIGAPGYSMAELAWIARHEEVHHLTDLICRRTPLGLTGSLTMPDLERLADLVSWATNSDRGQRNADLRATLGLLSGRNRARIAPTPPSAAQRRG